MDEPNLSDPPLCAELERMRGLRDGDRSSGPGRTERRPCSRPARSRAPGHRPRNAENLTDFHYRPEIAAQVADRINYIIPGDGAKEVLVKDDSDVTENQPILPSEGTLTNTHMFLALDTDQEKRYNGAFAKVSGA